VWENERDKKREKEKTEEPESEIDRARKI